MPDASTNHRRGGDSDDAISSRGAGFPIPLSPRGGDSTEDQQGAIRMLLKLGEIRGVRYARDLLTVEFVGDLIRLRNGKEYRKYGLTWAQVCAAIEIPESTVNEEIANLETFGSAVMKMISESELNRSEIRVLRSATTSGEIRILEESKEIVVGEQVLLISAETRDDVVSAFLKVLNREKDEKDEATAKLTAAEEQLAKGKAQMEAKEEEIEDRENQLKVAANIISVMRHDDPVQTEAGALTVRLAELVTQIEEIDFDKGEAARIYTRISGQLTRLARYAHGAMLDGDAALARLSPEVRQIILEGEAEDAREGFASEMGPPDDEDEAEEGDDA